MDLTEIPTIVTWPATHYVFVEKIGPFMQTARQAWEELHKAIPEISGTNEVHSYLGLYKMPDIYRAGVSLTAEPKTLPAGFGYEHFAGGKYSRFVLKGSYANLGPASGRVWQIVSESKLPLRDDYAIENYVNDPRTTAEAELITEILVATL